MKVNAIESKSYELAKAVIAFFQASDEGKYDKPLSKQLLRSGTSVGANVSEAQAAQSKADFKAKMTIAFKEAKETYYWIRLLHDTGLMDSEWYSQLLPIANENISLLVAITRSCNKV